MARQKPTPKALFEVKGDFSASLDNVCQEGINLLSTCDFLLKDEIAGLNPKLRPALQERVAAFRKALSADYDE